MREKERPRNGCEAPTHNRDCPCANCLTRDCQKCPFLTRDHFTPKCIAFKLLGWKYKRVNAESNIQYLTTPCHQDKDRTTQKRFDQLKLQMDGAFIDLGQHVT